MSSNLSPQSPMRPLSVGNVVSSALVLYRSHLKSYMQLSLAASLWSLIPIYGWAKSLAISALISRLAFCELIAQPETVNSARDRVNPRLWDFLVAGILISLMTGGLVVAFYIALIIFGVAFGISLSSGQPNSATIIIILLLVIFGLLAFFAALSWLVAKVMISEVTIAIENIDGVKAISRSWELTKGFRVFLRIQLIAILAFLITLPLFIVVQIPISIIEQILRRSAQYEPSALFLISFVLGYIAGLIINVLILPFWQSIKAVLYYDLRSRSEGLDLQLRDRRF